jgi:hypothetical protein
LGATVQVRVGQRQRARLRLVRREGNGGGEVVRGTTRLQQNRPPQTVFDINMDASHPFYTNYIINRLPTADTADNLARDSFQAKKFVVRRIERKGAVVEEAHYRHLSHGIPFS